MPPEPPRPPHAHIPGKTSRHPEGWFDSIRKTASPDLSEDELAASEAFKAGLIYLEEGYFWEAHEVLEPVWMACPEGSEPRALVQALIQLANARLKRRMNRPKAARRLYEIATTLLESITRDVVVGQSVAQLRSIVENENMKYIS